MKKTKIDLSLETQGKSISRLNSVVSSTVSQGPPTIAPITSTRSRSTAAKPGRRAPSRQAKDNDGFGHIVGFLDTIVDNSEQEDTEMASVPVRGRAPRKVAAPKTRAARGRGGSKAVTTARTSRAKPVSYVADSDDQEAIVSENDDGNDDFEIVSEGEIVESSAPRLTRKGASQSSSRRSPSVEPPKKSTRGLPWELESSTTKKAPVPRKTRQSKAAAAVPAAATKATRARQQQQVAPVTTKTTRASRFVMVPERNDPMVCL